MSDKKYNFKFINETNNGMYSNIPDHKLEYSISTDSRQDIISAFEDFLRGCGFTINGNLEVVHPED